MLRPHRDGVVDLDRDAQRPPCGGPAHAVFVGDVIEALKSGDGVGRAATERPVGAQADDLVQLARDQGTAFVMVTHDESLAARCDRVVRLVSGQLA